MTFLAQKDAGGAFKVYLSNGEHIRCGLEAKADGSVVPQGGTAKESSRADLFEPAVQYLVVLRFVNTGGPRGAVTSVALFEANESKIPTSQRQVKWDVVTPG